MTEFTARVGTFLYLMGAGFIILFIASDVTAATVAGRRTDYGLLFIGVLLFSVGLLFRRRAPPPPAAERFRIIRKYRENQKKKLEEKAKAQQQKK
jgi:hypothetical protein